MLDNDDTTGRGTQSDHGDFTARILPISDAGVAEAQAIDVEAGIDRRRCLGRHVLTAQRNDLVLGIDP
jgi:hypothetical protein